VNNIQADILLEFQKSISSIKRFSQGIDNLGSNFSGLEKRVSAISTALNNSEAIHTYGILFNSEKQSFDSNHSEKLKMHINNQLNRINNDMIEKIKNQVNAQIDSILQETIELQGGSNKAYRPSSSPDARKSNQAVPIDLTGVITNTVRNVIAGSNSGTPMSMLYQAIESYKAVQLEQIKMTQNLMLHNKYQATTSHGNTFTDVSMVSQTLNDIQAFIRELSKYYGTDYSSLHEVGSIGSRSIEDSDEIKKFIQLSAQLQTLDQGNNVVNIANALKSLKEEFGLNMNEVQKTIVEPIAAVSQITDANVMQLLEVFQQNIQLFKSFNVDPSTSIALSGASIQDTGGMNLSINNFYSNLLKGLHSTTAVSALDKLGVKPQLINTSAGIQILNDSKEFFTQLANKLLSANDETKNATYEAMFETSSLPSAASTRELLNTFIHIQGALGQFQSAQYEEIINKLLTNSTNNPQQNSYNIMLDSVLKSMTPTINKASYALINMSNQVDKNAQLLVAFSRALSNVLAGTLKFQQAKWKQEQVTSNPVTSPQPYNWNMSFLSDISDISFDNGNDTVTRRSNSNSSETSDQNENDAGGDSSKKGKKSGLPLKHPLADLALMGLEAVVSNTVAIINESANEALTLTENQRLMKSVKTEENLLNDFAQTLRTSQEEHGIVAASAIGMKYLLADGRNMVRGWFGLEADAYGTNEWNEDSQAFLSYYRDKTGINSLTINGLMDYLSQNNISYEDAVKEWSDSTIKGQAMRYNKQVAYNKQYEEAMSTGEEETNYQNVAKENYYNKYKNGELKSPRISTGFVAERLQENLSNISTTSSIDTLSALINGVRTDSEEYMALRKKSIDDMRKIADDELAIIDQYITKAQEAINRVPAGTDQHAEAVKYKEDLEKTRNEIANQVDSVILPNQLELINEEFQNNVKKVNRGLRNIDLLAESKELAAAYSMDTNSGEYYAIMETINQNKIASMTAELQNLKNISATGDHSEELALTINELQNSIAAEKLKGKENKLRSIGIARQEISDNSSERENNMLAVMVNKGITDDSSPLIRNMRIANQKAEVKDINEAIQELQAKLPTAGAEETTVINREIRDLQKQALQTQLGILDEMKSSVGTFNLPEGVTAMSRYEYMTRQGTHSTTTVGMGDVTVNITLPNVTNSATPEHLKTIGEGIGAGISRGSIGNLRNQLSGNPTSGYRSRYGS